LNTYAIADLHGRYDLLLMAISAIEADAGPAGGHLICLGDFVDRGPRSADIIRLFMAGPTTVNWKWTILQGNHEEMMLRCLHNIGLMNWWIGNGGAQTLYSYGYQNGDKLLPLKVPQEHLDWIEQLPVSFEDDQRIFVHAGLPPDIPLAEVKPAIAQWMLYQYDDVEVYNGAEYYQDAPHCSGKHLVHGHHQSATHPLLKPHRTNLDSFAWYTGRLAIGVFNDEQAAPVRCLEVKGTPA
jgi:serine/threonine protein phosphatase 1